MKHPAAVQPANGTQIKLGMVIQIPAGFKCVPQDELLTSEERELRTQLAQQGEMALRSQWSKSALPHLVMSFVHKLRADNGCVLVHNTVSAMDPRGARYIRRYRQEMSEQKRRSVQSQELPEG